MLLGALPGSLGRQPPRPSVGYGFSSTGRSMNRAEGEESIRRFLASINPATGFFD